MKIKALLFLSLLAGQAFSQISVAPSHIGPKQKFSKNVLAKFKNTETVFLLSTIYDKKIYEKILEDSWDVTPYRVEDLNTFNIENYLSPNYSFVVMGGTVRTFQERDNISQSFMNINGYAKVFSYVDVQMLNHEKILKKLETISPKKKEKELDDLLQNNTINIARFYIFPKDEFLPNAMNRKEKETEHSLATQDVFFNYKPGLLRNYFQKINNLIKTEDEYWLYGNDFMPELKNLSTTKLYIPSYILIKFNPFVGKDRDVDEASSEDLFKKYNYNYEIIEDTDLSEKIMNKEEFYYLRYVRMNTERFVQVVNSKTGEIVYRDYFTGMGYNLNNKQINNLNKSIAKASGN